MHAKVPLYQATTALVEAMLDLEEKGEKEKEKEKERESESETGTFRVGDVIERIQILKRKTADITHII
jgi:hypothetical protein